jgi:hypothetical protein
MNSIAPKTVLRDVLIGFGVGLVLMVSVTVATRAAADTSAGPPAHVLGK